MAKRQRRQGIPTELRVAQFEEFVLPHLTVGKRGPVSKLSLYRSFGYILKFCILAANGKSCPLKKMNQDVPRSTTHAFTVFFDDGNRTAA